MVFRISLILVLFLTFVNGQSTSAVNNRPEANVDVGPFSDLTLEISGPGRAILPLEPVPIRLRQNNRTGRPVVGYKNLSLDLPITLRVKRIGNSERVEIRDFSTIRKLIGVIDSTVPPGVTVETSEWLTLNLEEHFPSAGQYEVQAVLASSDRQTFIESNIEIFSIREPIGQEIAAFNLLKNSPFKNYIFNGYDFSRARPTLEQISATGRSNGYAKAAFFVLGQNDFHGRNYVRALAHLAELEDDPDFVFARKVREYLLHIRSNLNRQSN